MSKADFVQATTTSIAGASGNGAVTCTAMTGFPDFTAVFGSSPRNVDYVIEDTTGHRFEKGYGSIASGVLTRSLVHETWDGTTYTQVNASPLAFGSTPSSGAVVVRVAPTADAFIPAPPAIQTAVGDTYKGYQFSGHFLSAGTSGGAGISTGNEFYFPFLCLTRGKTDGFCLSVSTAGTAGNGIKTALYEVGPDGFPGNCITQFNEIIGLNTTGLKTDTAAGTWTVNAGPLRLGPTWYYIGLMTNDSAVQLTRWSSANALTFTPLGHVNGYGMGIICNKTAQNSYATGMPTGTPSGTYSANGGGTPGGVLLGLRINNS